METERSVSNRLGSEEIILVFGIRAHWEGVLVFLEEDLGPVWGNGGGFDICPVRRLETFRWLH